MADREAPIAEVVDVVRRWQSGNSQRQIATGTGLSRADSFPRRIAAALGEPLTSVHGNVMDIIPTASVPATPSPPSRPARDRPSATPLGAD